LVSVSSERKKKKLALREANMTETPAGKGSRVLESPAVTGATPGGADPSRAAREVERRTHGRPASLRRKKRGSRARRARDAS
jgi:hypothetical protein